VTSFLYDIDSEIVNKNQSKLDLQRVTIYVRFFDMNEILHASHLCHLTPQAGGSFAASLALIC